MIVQIYEIQTPQEAEKCIELGVDHVGSIIVSQDQWRVPELKEVIGLSEHTGTKNCLIPLFGHRDTLFRALDYYGPDYIHLCDSLTDNEGKVKGLSEAIAVQQDLRQKFPEIAIMRAIPVSPKGVFDSFPTLRIARQLEPVSDVFLTDTCLGTEPVNGFIGITGRTGDWDLTRKLVAQSNIPVIVAGGLSPENVFEALVKTAPAGADSCTQTNQVDDNNRPMRFKKDFQKVAAFVREVRRAEKEILPEA